MNPAPIARAGPLARDEIERSFVRARQPVVLSGLAAGSRLRTWTLAQFASRVPALRLTMYRRLLLDPADASQRSVEMVGAQEYAEGVGARLSDRVASSVRCVLDESCPELMSEIPNCPVADPARHIQCELFAGLEYSTAGHFHPKAHALLCHLEGEKDVIVYSPRDTSSLYPNAFLSEEYSTSRVDFFRPNRARFPRFERARALVARLVPGDALFIPAGFWHAVDGHGIATSLSYFWRARTREQASVGAAVRNEVAWAITGAVKQLAPWIERGPAWARERVARQYPSLIRR